jgi:hypothetical protein
MGHTLRSSGLLHMETSHVRISQYGLKTGVEDENERVDTMYYVGLFYPKIIIFIVLDLKCIVIL